MSLKAGPRYEIVVGSATNVVNLEWLPNVSGLFSTDMTYQHNDLLFVTLWGFARGMVATCSVIYQAIA